MKKEKKKTLQIHCCSQINLFEKKNYWKSPKIYSNLPHECILILSLGKHLWHCNVQCGCLKSPTIIITIFHIHARSRPIISKDDRMLRDRMHYYFNNSSSNREIITTHIQTTAITATTVTRICVSASARAYISLLYVRSLQWIVCVWIHITSW